MIRAESPKEIAEQIAYVDDSSGTRPDGHRILLLSACIHSFEAWSSFVDDWQNALDADSAIGYLHMKEARALDGQFSGWTAIARDLKVISLTEVLMRHRPHVVSCWVSANDHDELMARTGLPDLRNVYHLCFQAIVIKVAHYQMVRELTTPTDYVFDEQGSIGQEAALWYGAMKETAPSPLCQLMGSTPIFRDDKQVLPLQAADLCAWHKRRCKTVFGLDPEVAATLRVDELPGAEVEMDRKTIEGLSKQLSEVPFFNECRGGYSVYKKLKHAIRTGKKEI